MSHPNTMDNLMNALLGDELLGKSLSDTEKAAVRDMVQVLTGEIQTELKQDNNPPAPKKTDDNIEGIGELSENPGWKELLRQQTNLKLIDTLSDQVESANTVMEVLSTRPVECQALDILRHVELQLTALTIGVSDLRQAMEQDTHHLRPSHHWKYRARAFLLREFNFVNRWVGIASR